MNVVLTNGRAMHHIILFCSVIFIVAPLATQAQEFTFEFTVTLDNETTDCKQFGLREDALQGIDDYDLPEPPPVPGAGFDAYIAMFSGPTSLPNRWRYDFRPTVNLMSDRIELWQFEFLSNAIGSEVTIDIDTVGPVPVPYELYFFGPDVYYDPIIVPDRLIFTVSAENMVFFWELRLDSAVETTSTTWGDIKSLYR